MAGILGPLRSLVSVRTVARQVFVLQAAIVVLLIVAAVVALVLQIRTDTEREARNRSLAVAEAFAHAPGVVEALADPDPSAVLQPRAEAVREATDVDFIVVMTRDGVRYTHPDPDQIGKHFVGTTAAAAAGGVVRETYTGSLGPSVRAVVPVTDADGQVVGLVAAGVTLASVSGFVDNHLPVLLGSAAVALAVATAGTALVGRRLLRQTHGLEPAEMTRMYEHHDAVLHAVREGVLILDGQGHLALANDEARRLLGLTADAEGRSCLDLDIGRDLAQLFASGRDATDEVHLARGRLLAVSQRSTDRDGGPPGTVVTLRDTTELRTLSGRADVAQERLKLLYDAGLEIGTVLDVTHTSQELADFAVPRFADFVSVDLADPVLRGEEPREGRTDMRRVAFRGVREGSPLYPIGKLIHFVPGSPQAFGFGTGRSVLEADMPAFTGWQEQDPENARKLVEFGIHSMLTVPLRARGVIMGMATFWRADRPEPFEQEEVSLAEELVARAAVSIDNARRYTREHTLSVTLQRSLLPRALPEQSALDVAYRYLPAQAAQGGAGGDWFDVIPLPGARVALVVGDVVGHGLHAAATMGRLRTAVHNFSTLDLPPDELLGHLDELVARIDQDEGDGAGEGAPVTGATCLYAVYDPSSGLCTLSRAGHLEPAVVHPGGQVEFPAVPGGPPLGLAAGLPFEATELRLPEGSGLVLYTDGLVEGPGRDIDEGLALLRRTLAAKPPTRGRPPEETCQAVLEAMLSQRPRDDVALVVARTRILPADRTAAWDVPDDPSAVARVRAVAARTLDGWGLAEEAFTTELILSELVTNAIRHATGPIRVRLIRDRALICEVSDASSTAPHLRSAATTDEGGRGLFLVAQFAERWGTRYTAHGKVIWTEQPLAAAGRAAPV
ncbi:SpoIIE family protein phosphatase [Streptomyces sp. ISL-22]|uniref:SpoIIE family protein phosphatase/ATP-binding protein n=1 Tax=unclassified Streptomyces TaxID=2593676 RepID=UPI001BEC4A53|nr:MULTISPECIES: SpoIIE family protein phosphatase/ATP-binding protein [unclassified Streptomyces]MBT2422822.1 SpoIIE family protein phosphatase [Streptomyces sp. ISL-24]MBT2431097.1 SpoIIE family protein phosphatase [Streptomyces sp. ISL-22]